MCISPVTIKRDYRRTESEVSEGYNTMTDTVPCGKCHECLASRRNSWAFRLWQQSKVAETAYFITLTYETEPKSKNGHGTLLKSDVQKFIKRLRKASPKYPYIKTNGTTGYTSKIRYYCCGEYGGTFLRPHYHLIMYDVPEIFCQSSELFSQRFWQHGQVDIAPANIATIFYTVGYVMKGKWQPQQDEECPVTLDGEIRYDDRVPEYSAMSKNLGLNYLSENVWDWHIDRMANFVIAQNGSIMSLPRYYRDKIFSREEKKELAMEARLLRDYKDWDFDLEVQRKNAAIRQHEKEQKLKRLKL